jgi:holo-[acyl-carrier protein] synthase
VSGPGPETAGVPDAPDAPGVAEAAVVGVGVDAVDLDRFRVVLGRRRRLAERVFTEGERADARAAADPVPRLAARFAAKEAVMKALGVGLGAFALADVEVVRDPSGSPSLVLHGSAADRARAAGVARWHLSLTHSGLVALAMVVAAGRGGAATGAGAGAGAPAAP